VDEVVFGVVIKGMVDVTRATEVTDTAVIVVIGPNCEMTGCNMDEGSTEPDEADAKV
ncbi:hypothetical protein KI387_024330, partial [Taxus chinensis]